MTLLGVLLFLDENRDGTFLRLDLDGLENATVINAANRITCDSARTLRPFSFRSKKGVWT